MAALALAVVPILASVGCRSSAGPPAAQPSPRAEPTARYGVAGAFDPGALLGPRDHSAVVVRFGMAVPGASLDKIEAVETSAGARLGVVRVFARWDSEFPSANHQALLGAGRSIHLSVRPRTDAGRVIRWAEIATAEPGSEIDQALNRWTSTVAAFGSQIYFTLNHEPETEASAGSGTPADYEAAWRHLVERLRANGGHDVKTVLVLGRGAYADGSAAQWYPGDDVVDVVGVDPYNWYDCQGQPRPWMGPAELIAPALAFAEIHHKPLAIPEIASTEDPADSLRKATWIVELAQTLASPAVADHLEFAAWFSVDDPSWPACQWRYDSSAASRQAMARVVGWLNQSGPVGGPTG